MDAKKYISLVLLGMIIILPLFTTSCFKKGDEDPFSQFILGKREFQDVGF